MASFEFDIFLSYARANNRAKWVTDFRNALEDVLREEPDVSDVNVFMDEKDIEGGRLFDDRILRGLESASVLMIVVSKASLSREWCRRERDEFIRNAGGVDRANGRVFLVNYDGVDPSGLPDGLRRFTPYQFFEVDPTTNVVLPGLIEGRGRFHTSLYHLRDDLLRSFRRLGAPALSRAAPPETTAIPAVPTHVNAVGPETQLTVFVADVNLGVLETQQFDKVVSAVQQRALVVPERRTFIHADEGFEAEVSALLRRADLFIQLPSPIQCRDWSHSEHGYERWLFEQALAQHTPVLRWHSRDVDLSRISDAEYKAFLFAECPLLGAPKISDLAEFISTIYEELDRIDTARKRSIERRTPDDDCSVCVLVDDAEADIALGDEIATTLEGLGAHEPELVIASDDLDFQLTAESLRPRGLVVGWQATDKRRIDFFLRDCRRYRSSCELHPPECAIVVPSKATHRVHTRPPRFAVLAQDEIVGIEQFVGRLSEGGS